MAEIPHSFVDLFLAQLQRLRFKNLFLVALALFLLDVAVPDFVPFIDELLLGVLSLLFWAWRKPRVIDG